MVQKKTFMKKFYLLALLAFSLIQFSCSSKKYYEGLYEGERYLITLKEGNYLIKDKFSNYYLCCDTLSYGIYEKVKNNSFIKFTSDQFYLNEYIDSEINESVDDNEDTLFFNINNPIENLYVKENFSKREIYYKIVLFSNKSFIDSKIANQKWYQKQIKISVPKDIKLKYFYIEIFAEEDVLLTNRIYNKFSTFEYKLENFKSNYFEIDINNLNYNFLNFLRLDGEYLKIKKNKLIWKNEEFILVNDAQNRSNMFNDR